MRFCMKRFQAVHAERYESALQELRSGTVSPRWSRILFPQLQKLGQGSEAWYYGIQDWEEAAAYLNDPLLSAHIKEMAHTLLALDIPIGQILDYPGNLQLRASMTLFWLVSREAVFRDVLDKFFDGSMDDVTVRRLQQHLPEADTWLPRKPEKPGREEVDGWNILAV